MGPMAGMAELDGKLSQLCPQADKCHLDTCTLPDGSNLGQSVVDGRSRRKNWKERDLGVSEKFPKLVENHGTSVRNLASTDPNHSRVSNLLRDHADPRILSDNGVYQQTKDRMGISITKMAAPKPIRALHEPRRGKKRAWFTISVRHVGPDVTADDLRILGDAPNGTRIAEANRHIEIARAGVMDPACAPTLLHSLRNPGIQRVEQH